MRPLFRRVLVGAQIAALSWVLAACGGGEGSSGPPVLPKEQQPAQKDVVRFLSQAGFGGAGADIDRTQRIGFPAWIDEQFSLPQDRHQGYVDSQIAAATLAGQSTNQQNWIYESFWRTAVSGNGQLRHRVAFALSQIFVVSLADSSVGENTRGVASYLDMLGRNAFGNFRTLLQDVTLHPMMGLYLSHLRNQKEDPSRGRVPDENYAREVMQLFTIGLYELNLDGTVRLDGRNEPIETYTNEDVTGLAKVFTGWSWAGPDKSDTRFFGGNASADRAVLPMQSYPKYHSTSEKRFLGTVIPEQAGADPEASLRVALDRLFSHPNVGPFIGKQLIQRMVTSNPSPAYVARVASAFNDNGSGVRGDMKAVIRAVLLDPEARSPLPGATDYGKLREPVLRIAHWLRAFGAQSASGRFLIGNTDNPNSSLGQTPMRSPSVFNFYRPGYVPPNTDIAAAGLVAPEMQITHESSVAGYLNTLRSVISSGIGSGSPRDVQPDYGEVIGLADRPDALVDRIGAMLIAGEMSPELRAQAVDAVGSVAVSTSNAQSAATARLNRVKLAVFLVMASPDYLVQK
ncbi:MAG: DUF1800 domain-containing protein [Burkholderiaceae bacterium]|jgi:uncharacterized protein (DUF1800 family)|nr:DUF1800 domain-containing protein [Burkholderiaceae bacterium]